MNYAIHRISLDVTDDSPSQLTIAAKQGDTAKLLIISLLDDKKNYQIAPNSVAVLIARKPNGVWFEHPCKIDYANNKVLYEFQEPIYDEEGKLKSAGTVSTTGTIECEIHLSYSTYVTKEDGSAEAVTEDLTTASFIIAVHETILHGLTDNTEEVNLIPELVSKGSALIAQLENNAIPNAEEATESANAAANNANIATANANTAASGVEDAIANANNLVQEVEDKLANGEFDGVSPTHSFEGTVLTMTSASGTTSVDLKGEKGDKGDRGVDAVPTIIPIELREDETGEKYVRIKYTDFFKRYRIIPAEIEEFRHTVSTKLIYEDDGHHYIVDPFELELPPVYVASYIQFEILNIRRELHDMRWKTRIQYRVNDISQDCLIDKDLNNFWLDLLSLEFRNVKEVYVYNDDAIVRQESSQWYVSLGQPPVIGLGNEGFNEGDMCLVSVAGMNGDIYRFNGTEWVFTNANIQGYKGDKGDTGAKIVETVYVGKDENGGNVYKQVFDNGVESTFTAPKGEDGSGGGASEELVAQVEQNTSDIATLQTDKVGKTDYATSNNVGVIKLGAGLKPASGGMAVPDMASNAMINAKVDAFRPIVSKNVDYAVKTGITTNTETLTDEEKTSALTWLGVKEFVEEEIAKVNMQSAKMYLHKIVSIQTSESPWGEIHFNLITSDPTPYTKASIISEKVSKMLDGTAFNAYVDLGGSGTNYVRKSGVFYYGDSNENHGYMPSGMYGIWVGMSFGDGSTATLMLDDHNETLTDEVIEL